MSAVIPNSISASTTCKEDGAVLDPPKELDAGALFVLKSRGSWLHCGYHLTTSIVAPSLLSLPFALALQGWVGGVLSLILAGLLTFYSYNLLSLVLEHHAQLGHRQLRFRDMARDILGPRWGKYVVGPLQFGMCYGAVIAGVLLGGQSLKFIYILSNPKGTMKLYEFTIIFGVLMLFLAQIPSFHSLRYINLLSLFLSLAYSACVTASSIYIGLSKNAPNRDYSVNGSEENRVFGAVNAVSIIVTTYACGIVPEIQATVAPPVKGKMFKGLCVCYAVIFTTFFSVAISGYWAFGNQAMGTILANFMGNKKPLLPTWFLLMTNVFTVIQVSAVTLATIAPLVKGKIFKGLCLCHGVVVTTFFSVAVSGCWAFGNQAMAKTILENFMGDKKHLLPTGFLLMMNVFTLLQVTAVTVKFADTNVDQFSIRNVVPTPKGDVPINGSDHGYNICCSVTFLWRYHGIVWMHFP